MAVFFRRTQFASALAFITLLILAITFKVWSQGVAVPHRVARPLPKINIDIPLPKVHFEDIAAKAGLTAVHVNGSRDQRYIIETTGSGVAIFDYDNDGWMDLFMVNGSTLEGFPSGKEPINHLYRNKHDGTFEDVTEKANLVHSGWGQGICAGDFDNDGDEDLFVTYFGQNVFYRNEGNGTFTDITEKAGLLHKNPRWNTGCTFIDYDKDGKLDLFVAEYVIFDIKKVPAKGFNQNCQWKGVPVMCGPRGLPGGMSSLYHNNGDGTFKDVSVEAGVTKPSGYYGFSPLASDYDNDGWPDIYLSNDSTPNILFHNNGNGTFTDQGLISGSAFNEDGQEQAGMGVSVADYDNDGYLDIVKCNFADDTPTLYHNNRDGSFTDVTFSSGMGVNTRFLGWGNGFFDVDNDGWKDIYMVNGHVYPEVNDISPDSPYKQERLVFWNIRNGTFVDISGQSGPGILEPHCSRGSALGDLDNDGSLEIFINNKDERPSLLKNLGVKRNWIMFKTVGKLSNRDGIGARVRVYANNLKLMDDVRSGNGYISHSDMRLHFGLGEAAKVDRVEVSWPSGRKDVHENLKVNQLVVLEEGKVLPAANKVAPGKGKPAARPVKKS
ncbi:MAG: CRTAC1 family protein [Terriglobia bacterium]